MTVKLLAQWGDQPPGTLYTAATAGTETAMIAAGQATATLTDGVVWVPPGSSPDRTTEVYFDPVTQSLVLGAGKSFLRGAVVSGDWVTVPSIFRLRFTGTGTAIMDSRDSLGVVTSAVESYTLTSATDQIEFPYAGDNAVAIRVTLTGDVTCEVI